MRKPARQTGFGSAGGVTEGRVAETSVVASEVRVVRDAGCPRCDGDPSCGATDKAVEHASKRDRLADVSFRRLASEASVYWCRISSGTVRSLGSPNGDGIDASGNRLVADLGLDGSWPLDERQTESGSSLTRTSS